MTKAHHHQLPQLAGGMFLTDGGMETTLIFHDGIDLPHFAAFMQLASPEGRERVVRYYERYLDIAAEAGTGFILETPTWRASKDWGEKLGLGNDAIAAVNRDATRLMQDLAAKYRSPTLAIVISGNIGPRGDGYVPGELMTADEAQTYHADQIGVLAKAGCDFVSAFTLTNVSEAIGIVRAAKAADIPVVISFTLETDGRLPAGQTLAGAIREVDGATSNGAAYFMINCAHPEHFADMLGAEGPWVKRIRGLRANASRRSHQELNDAPELDAGDPVELGAQYADLLKRLPHVNVLGGCCGTDHRHVAAISGACVHSKAASFRPTPH